MIIIVGAKHLVRQMLRPYLQHENRKADRPSPTQNGAPLGEGGMNKKQLIAYI